jgi:hypothetical protein
MSVLHSKVACTPAVQCDGMATGIPTVKSRSHRLIQNCLVLPGQLVSSTLTSSHHQVALQFRNGGLQFVGMDDMLPPPELAPSVVPDKLAVGANHATFGFRDGTIATYGSNEQRQVNVPTEQQLGLTFPSGLKNIWEVSAGSAHTVALTADGQVVAWGGTAGQSDVPLVARKGITRVRAARYHSLALTGFLGQLVAWGNSDGWDSSSQGKGRDSSEQILPYTLTAGGVADFAGGARFTAVLRTDGSLRVVGNPGASSDVTAVPDGAKTGASCVLCCDASCLEHARAGLSCDPRRVLFDLPLAQSRL